MNSSLATIGGCFFYKEFVMLREAWDDLMEVIGLYKEEVEPTHEEMLTALERESLGRLLYDVQLPDSGMNY